MYFKKLFYPLIFISLLLLTGCSKGDSLSSHERYEKNDNCYYKATDIVQYSSQAREPLIETAGENIFYTTTGSNLVVTDKEGKNTTEIYTMDDDCSLLTIDSVDSDSVLLIFAQYKENQSDFSFLEIDSKGNHIREGSLGVSGSFSPIHAVVDSEQKIYVYTGEGMLMAFGSNGEKKHELPLDATVSGLYADSKDRIILGQIKEELLVLSCVDKKTFELSKQAEIPFYGSEYSQGLFSDSNASCYYYDENYLYKYIESKELADPILNWMDTGINIADLNTIGVFSDNSILIAIQGTTDNKISLERLIPTKEIQDKEQTEIVLACVGLNSILRERVSAYNEENEDCRILIKNYEGKEDPYNALNLDLISGADFDIICLSEMPVKKYIQKNLLADLSGYIKKEDFVDSYIQAVTEDGKIHEISPSFTIHTILGSDAEVGESIGWTLEEYEACLKKNEHKLALLYADKQDLLRQICQTQINDFVDFEKGTDNFNSKQFVEILNFAKNYQSAMEQDRDEMDIDLSKLLYDKELILLETTISSGNDYRSWKLNFGDEIVAKGYPSNSKQGNYMSLTLPLGISSSSRHKEEAWDFISYFLTEEAQYQSEINGFPTRKDALAHMYKIWQEKGVPKEERLTVSIAGEDKAVPPMTKKDIEKMNEIIASAGRLIPDNREIVSIIREESEAFFNNQTSAGQTAEYIHNRVHTYISEQN